MWRASRSPGLVNLAVGVSSTFQPPSIDGGEEPGCGSPSGCRLPRRANTALLARCVPRRLHRFARRRPAAVSEKQSWQTRSLGSDMRSMRTLQRAFWNGQPETLRGLFALLETQRVSRGVHALESHVRVGTPPRGRTARLPALKLRESSQTIERTSDEWRAAMLAEGWT